TARFSDPLTFNSFSTRGGVKEHQSTFYGLRYDNRRFRLNWGLLATYEQDPIVFPDKKVIHDNETAGEIYFSFPFMFSTRHGVDYDLGVRYEKNAIDEG